MVNRMRRFPRGSPPLLVVALRPFCFLAVLGVFAPLVAAATDASRRLGLLVVDGAEVLDAGSLATPASVGAAPCCAPLASSSVLRNLRVVAGLSYRLTLRSAGGTLGSNASQLRLKLLQKSRVSETCSAALGVADFGDADSAVDGQAPATSASAVANVWDNARFPFNGTFLLCYWDGVGWDPVDGLEISAFGAPEVGRFYCVAEPNLSCFLRIGPSPDPSGRIRLLEPPDACGGAASAPDPQPFERAVSQPIASLHGLGQVALVRLAQTYRVCFCREYEYDVSSDGSGPCRSSGARDFPQSLGLLYMSFVATVPDTVYQGLRFSLYVHCGNQSASGCQASAANRMRLIDYETAQVATATDQCTYSLESKAYAAPVNCGGSFGRECNLIPSASNSPWPVWQDILVQLPSVLRLAWPRVLGVCFCDSGCVDAEAWRLVGIITVRELEVYPEQFVVGQKTDVRIVASSDGWTKPIPPSQALKLLYDPHGMVYDGLTCLNASQANSSILNHRCVGTSECSRPDITNANVDGYTWRELIFSMPGYYSVCYCDAQCDQPQYWNYVARRLVAGPTEMYVGTRQKGASAFAGLAFDLTLLGVGLSAGDKIAFLPGVVANCGLPSAATAHVPIEIAAPILLTAQVRGDIIGLYGGASTGSVTMVTAFAHGLEVGDRIRFEDVTTRAGSVSCLATPPGASVKASTCAQRLMAESTLVTRVPSSTIVDLELELSAQECNDLDFSEAFWTSDSREIYQGLLFPRGMQGKYSVCWGYASAGVLDVVAAPSFRSALSLTSIVPGVDAPSILAFQLGNAEAYARSPGSMSLRLSFRSPARLRHSFDSSAASLGAAVLRSDASQGVCGLLFLELWSDAADGFPLPSGCYYSDALHEYGLVFPARAGLHAGMRYQIVMQTHLSILLMSDHEWLDMYGRAPFPSFEAAEVLTLAPRMFGDVGPRATILSCKEACARRPTCNVAIYRPDTDLHCLLGDFSARDEPYLTRPSEKRVDVTMFLVDRLNTTNPNLQYVRDGSFEWTRDVVVDLWSLDDLPFSVVETSEAATSGRAGLPAGARDPRWHLRDGLKVVDPLGHVSDDEPLKLLHEDPELSIRLRAAREAPITAGSIIRMFLAPFTQWELPRDCVVECDASADNKLRCPKPSCTTQRIVVEPWLDARNVLRIALAQGMSPITETVMHTIRIAGRSLPLPVGGFLPKRLGAEVSRDDSDLVEQPRVDYTTSIGVLPFTDVGASSLVFKLDGNNQPFRGAANNELYVRLVLGASLFGGALATSARLTLELPPGYDCTSAVSASTGLRTLALLDRDGSGEGRGELGASGGQWSVSGNSCIFSLAANAMIYAGSAFVAKLTVTNPAFPLIAAVNVWTIRLEGKGDLPDSAAPLPLRAQPMASRRALATALFAASAEVLGLLAPTSLVPSDASAQASQSLARVFFCTQQSSGEDHLWLRLLAPSGFGFQQHCVVEDLPEAYYRKPQGPYASSQRRLLDLGPHRQCSGFRTDAAQGFTSGMDLVEVTTSVIAVANACYGFAIQVLNPQVQEQGVLGRTFSFTMTTYAGSFDSALDQSASMPLSIVTAQDAYPGYSIFPLLSSAGTLHVNVENMLPYIFIRAPSKITVLLHPGLDSNSSDLTFRSRSTKLSWRVIAPADYEWAFNEQTFRYRLAEVPNVTASLPISRLPVVPLAPPMNCLTFFGQDESVEGWRPFSTYGFSALIRVPAETPRISANEWIVEFGFDRSSSTQRALALRETGQDVRVVHSFFVRSLVSSTRGESNELLFQFGTVSSIPRLAGSIVIEAPATFVFEAACSLALPSISYLPYEPLSGQIDCAASSSVVVAGGGGTGSLRPVVVLRPVDSDIPPGLWVFVLKCLNPSSADDVAAGAVGFVLSTFADHNGGVAADLGGGSVDSGVDVLEEMPFGAIVDDVDYQLSGRDDHPGQGSNVVLSFELREPATTPKNSVDGVLHLKVRAPEGFEFNRYCRATIGDTVFGVGQPYAAPFVPFESGVRVLSCDGYKHFADISITRGLLQRKRYALQMRVDSHPLQTPSRNVWQVSLGAETTPLIAGYELWTFKDLSLAMTEFSRWNPNTAAMNDVDLTFTPSNLITSKGMLAVVAPVGFVIPANCDVSIARLASDGVTAVGQVLGPICSGDQPPTNHAQIRFTREDARVEPGALYRLTVRVRNPAIVPSNPGQWSIKSYWSVSANPSWIDLADIGSLPSLPITEYFSVFAVERPPSDVSENATDLLLRMSLSLPYDILVGDVVLVSGPPGYDFAVAVADDSLLADLRWCLRFEAEALSAMLPVPSCAGVLIRFQFKAQVPANTSFRFLTASSWPKATLTAATSVFTALHRLADREPLATALALVAPVTPRLEGFLLRRVGRRADAIGSVGDIELRFTPAQDADVITMTSRMQLQTAMNFSNCLATVQWSRQLIKEVLVLRPYGGGLLVLALRLLARQSYVVVARGVTNPPRDGTVLWTVRTYTKPSVSTSTVGVSVAASGVSEMTLDSSSALEVAPVQSPLTYEPADVLSWVSAQENLRDELADRPATRTLGLVTVRSAFLESGFFDIIGTVAKFTISIGPGEAPAGCRLLVVAPRDWRVQDRGFVAGSNFPAYDDLGSLQCQSISELRSVYRLRFQQRVPAMEVCPQNVAQMCVKELSFSLRVNTAPTPLDLSRWRRDADQSWLFQLDVDTTSNCSSADPGALDPSVVGFTNDALFPGFPLKESLGNMVVTPQSDGRLPYQSTSVKVTFISRSPSEAAAGGRVLLRLSAAAGLEFSYRCLATDQDPDYEECIGSAEIAVLVVRASVFPAGDHGIAIRVLNPARTPNPNWWKLETFVGLPSAGAAFGADAAEVQQLGRAVGYEVQQNLEVKLRPSISDVAGSGILFVWLRPSVYIEPDGILEIHAADGFGIACEPHPIALSFTSGECVQYMAASGADPHASAVRVVELKVPQGFDLIPMREYEFGVYTETPRDVVQGGLWGILLRSASREVLEANMNVDSFNLTSAGLTLLDLAPSTSLKYAFNQVRLMLSFSKPVDFGLAPDILIIAPLGWDLRPLCARFQEITSGEDKARNALPYSNERGHHICPQARALVLLMRPQDTLQPGIHVLLIGAVNPGATPSENFWSVSLLTPAANLGWTPDMATEAGFKDGFREGQRIVAVSSLPGFVVGAALAPGNAEALPLPGQVTEVLSADAGPRPLLLASLVIVLFVEIR